MQQPARRACASLIANLRGSCWLQTSTAAPAVGYSSCLSSSEQPSTSGSAGRRAYSTDDGSKPVESIGNEKVQALATQIMSLTVLEASWLSEILRKKLNIQKPAFGAMPMGMPVAMPAAPSTSAPAASAADAAPVEKKEKTEFEVKLASFTPEGKIKVIKEIRAITNLGLKEAKELVEKAPVTIKANVAKADAETMKKQIEAAGAKVELL